MPRIYEFAATVQQLFFSLPFEERKNWDYQKFFDVYVEIMEEGDIIEWTNELFALKPDTEKRLRELLEWISCDGSEMVYKEYYRTDIKILLTEIDKLRKQLQDKKD